jgi:hypothetical protein
VTFSIQAAEGIEIPLVLTHGQLADDSERKLRIRFALRIQFGWKILPQTKTQTKTEF